MKILKAVWFILESICLAIGLTVLISILTTVVNGSNLVIKKNGEQVYCYSMDSKQCLNLEEEK